VLGYRREILSCGLCEALMGGRTLGFSVAVAALLAAMVSFAPGASARSASSLLLSSCGPETTPFAQWGDIDGYCAFPNLGFEDGSAGWTLTGDAAVVSGNEPWDVSGPGSHALSLGPGATALSSSLPIDLLDPWIRFFARSSGASGPLAVRVVFHGLLGNLTGVLNVGTLASWAYGDWQPTQRVLSALAVPLGTTSAQIYLQAEQAQGSWLLDDAYLDPCVSRVR